MSKKVENNYGADQIQVLEGLEAVRKRPGMYIGSTSSRGLHHLVWEIVDNSVDEALAGYGSKIITTIHKDNSISVTDFGRGLPVDMHTMGLPAAEVILTVLHAGGKFGGGGYKVSGGLHGVGSSVVNALSSEMTATIRRNGKIYQIGFERGITSTKLHEIGKCDPSEIGTTIWFKPDEEIFKETTVYDTKRIFEKLRQTAFLNKNLNMIIIDEREIDDETGTYVKHDLLYEQGIVEYVAFVNKNKKPYHKDIFYMKDTLDGIEVEIALQYHDGDSKDGIYSFANNIHTHEGGTHETGFKTALTNVVKAYIDDNHLMKGKKEKPNGDDTRVGITSIISVKISDPEFEGQTKSKLGTSEAQSIVNALFNKHFSDYLTLNPNTANIIIERIIQSCELRIRMKAAREAEKKKLKSKSTSTSKPIKLAPPNTKNPEKNELYLVEGDSAGGSAKSGRDREFQGIMPLRGKVLNTEKTDAAKVLENLEIRDIASAVGTGLGDDFEYENLQYNKVILMTDADVDGEHINVLLLTFLYRYMRPLIEKGHVYLAMPPLFKVWHGKKSLYAYSDTELKEIIAKEFPSVKPGIQRYKGLGEMNAQQLWDTTMDPETRTLIQVSIDDAAMAEILFTDLMGSEVSPRKQFIDENAVFAVLDI